MTKHGMTLELESQRLLLRPLAESGGNLGRGILLPLPVEKEKRDWDQI